MKRLLALILTVALGCAGTALAEAPRWPAVDSAISPLVERAELPGVVTLALKDGRVVHASAIGKADLATGAPMKMDTIVRAFSMTKPVTAVAMGILYDEGKWRPEDPVATYLPELADLKVFKGLDAEGKPILAAPATQPTVGQLMTHTAGFSYGFMPGYVDEQYRANNPMRAKSTAELLKMIAALPLAYEPGTQWRYSLSMDIEGMIVERITGQRLDDFMAARIFKPLKMADTGFYVPADKRARFAALYEWRDGKLQPPTSPGLFTSEYAQPPGVTLGGAGLVSTAGDYARLAQMLLNGGDLDGVRILSRKTVTEIMTSHLSPQIVNARFGIGIQQIRPGYEYGWNGVVVTDPAAAKVALGKGSYLWDGAAGTWFWVDPENKVVFVGMVQRLMGPGFPPLQPLTQRAVMDSLGQPPPK